MTISKVPRILAARRVQKRGAEKWRAEYADSFTFNGRQIFTDGSSLAILNSPLMPNCPMRKPFPELEALIDAFLRQRLTKFRNIPGADELGSLLRMSPNLRIEVGSHDRLVSGRLLYDMMMLIGCDIRMLWYQDVEPCLDAFHIFSPGGRAVILPICRRTET